MRALVLALALASVAAQPQCPQEEPVQVVALRGDPMPVWPRRYIIDLRDVNERLAPGYAESKRVWRTRLQHIWDTDAVRFLWEFRDPTGVYQWAFFIDKDYEYQICFAGDCHNEYVRDCRVSTTYVLEDENDGYWYGGATDSSLGTCDTPQAPNPGDAYRVPESEPVTMPDD